MARSDPIKKTQRFHEGPTVIYCAKDQSASTTALSYRTLIQILRS